MNIDVVERRSDKHSDKAKKNKILKRVLMGVIIVVLISAWLFIVKYGIDLGKEYIDDALSAVEMRGIESQQRLVEQNTELNKDIETLNGDIEKLRSEITALNDEILLFSLEVRSLKSSIDIIDTSVTNSVEIQAEFGSKIQDLDDGLQELRKSLNILLEAPSE